MSRFFKKIKFSQPFQFSGARVSFDHVGGDTGVRKLDDAQEAPLIAELDRAADARRGGVVRISAEIYDDLIKKKAPSTPSARPSRGLQPIRAYSPQTLSPSVQNPARAAVESAGGVSPRPGDDAVKIMVPPPTANQRPSHAPGFKLNSKPRSEVEAKVKEATAPE